MTPLEPAVTQSWHAHIDFDARAATPPGRCARPSFRRWPRAWRKSRCDERPGDALGGHRERALWLGLSPVLNLAALDA